MRKQIISFLAGVALVTCLAFNNSVQEVIFKPKPPLYTYVQTFNFEQLDVIADYIKKKINQGYVVKVVSMSSRKDSPSCVEAIVVMEKYK